jgi:sulfur carrier protein
MNIFFNGEEKSTNAHNILEFLKEIDISEQKGIAVALNQEVISKSDWEKIQITENDQIIIIRATQGG